MRSHRRKLAFDAFRRPFKELKYSFLITLVGLIVL